MSSSLSSCGLFAAMSTMSLLICPCPLEKAEFKGSKVNNTHLVSLSLKWSAACVLLIQFFLLTDACYRSSAGLFPDRRLLSEPLPGGAAAAGGGRGSPGVPGDPSDRHPGAQGADDQTHVRRPLRCESESFSSRPP